MKIIFTAADYGMLDCVTDGILKAIRFGLLKNITVITNNQSIYRAAEEIKKYPEVSMGQEINFVSGTPISAPSLIPSLVTPNGDFISSRQRQAMGKEGRKFAYEDCLIECENQVKRFIELMGKKPVYISCHSFGSIEARTAIADIADKYDILCQPTHDDLFTCVGWYKNVPGKKGAYTPDLQAATDVEEHIITNKTDALGHEWASIGTHCGYNDEELVRMSSYNVIRTKELFALTSPKVKKWLEDNNAEVSTIEEFMKCHEYDKQKSREKFIAPRPEWIVKDEK